MDFDWFYNCTLLSFSPSPLWFASLSPTQDPFASFSPKQSLWPRVAQVWQLSPGGACGQERGIPLVLCHPPKVTLGPAAGGRAGPNGEKRAAAQDVPVSPWGLEFPAATKGVQGHWQLGREELQLLSWSEGLCTPCIFSHWLLSRWVLCLGPYSPF